MAIHRHICAYFLCLLLTPSAAYAKNLLMTDINRLLINNPKAGLFELQKADFKSLGIICNDAMCNTLRLDANVLDAVLETLAKHWKQYPADKVKIERIILKWNFCKSNLYNYPHNIFKPSSNALLEYEPNNMRAQWLGFRTWGLLEQDPDDRVKPLLLMDKSLHPVARSQFQFKIYKQQCFPNPLNGFTTYDTEKPMYSQEYRKVTIKKVQFTSVMPTVVPKEQPRVLKPKPIHKKEKKLIVKRPSKHVRKAKTSFKSKYNKKQKLTNRKAMFTFFPKQNQEAHLQLKIGDSLKPLESAPSALVFSANAKYIKLYPQQSIERYVALKLIHQLSPNALTQIPLEEPIEPIKNITLPLPAKDIEKELPLWSVMSRSPIVVGQSKQGYLPQLKASGDIYLRYRTRDSAWLTGVSANWSPYNYFYVRGSLEVQQNGSNNTPEYTWGIGYSDWQRTGISIGINQWTRTPIDQPFDSKNLTTSISYNVDLPSLLSLSSSWYGNLGLSYSQGVPQINSSLQYDLGGSWFVRSGLSYRYVKGGIGDFGWTYGFGRWNWQHNSINIEFNNWGYNKAFEPNYKQNGSYKISWRWNF